MVAALLVQIFLLTANGALVIFILMKLHGKKLAMN